MAQTGSYTDDLIFIREDEGQKRKKGSTVSEILVFPHTNEKIGFALPVIMAAGGAATAVFDVCGFGFE